MLVGLVFEVALFLRKKKLVSILIHRLNLKYKKSKAKKMLNTRQDVVFHSSGLEPKEERVLGENVLVVCSSDSLACAYTHGYTLLSSSPFPSPQQPSNWTKEEERKRVGGGAGGATGNRGMNATKNKILGYEMNWSGSPFVRFLFPLLPNSSFTDN